jgi:hypothetical protein
MSYNKSKGIQVMLLLLQDEELSYEEALKIVEKIQMEDRLKESSLGMELL